MKSGFGKGMTRIDNRNVSDQLYAKYAVGLDSRATKAVAGEEPSSDDYLKSLELTDNVSARRLRIAQRCVVTRLPLNLPYVQHRNREGGGTP